MVNSSEEGARFPKMAVSSGVWAGQVPLEDAWNLKEVTANHDSPKTMKEELTRIGYLGKNPASYRSNPFAAHFELHIEQGPILEDQGQKIGVVEGTIWNFRSLFFGCVLIGDLDRRPSLQVV